MKLKSLIIFILVVFVLIGFKKSFAQPTEESLPARNGDLIRVAISTNDFSTLEYKEISITSDAGFVVTNKNDDSEIITASPREILKFQIDKNRFNIHKNDLLTAEKLEGPFEITAEGNYPLQIVGLKRKGKPATYRGSLEITATLGKTDKFSAINVLPLEEYLRGVVPNELPVSFGLEALKAQSVAARNYALRPRTKPNKLFDVCDSVQSQVYYGANTEEPLSDRAVKETKGLLALYEGDIILALYSSTAGGYTESYENAFSELGSERFPANPLPYLKGKPDIEGTPSLNTEEAARVFYTSSPQTFDNNSAYFRWTREWTEEELRKELNQSLSKFYKSGLISPAFEKGFDIGKIKKIEVLSRGVSGKAREISIMTENGCWTVKKELLIRRILTNKGKALPSANVILNNLSDENGNLVKLEAIGGGFGHGVGMSQYGAGFMSKNGYTFDQILQHYYDGISVGTRPVTLKTESAASAITQEFFSPSGKADLLIENNHAVEQLDFMINSKKITLNKNYLPDGRIRMPLENYTVKGLNNIVFYPLNENKKLKLWIEVVKAK